MTAEQNHDLPSSAFDPSNDAKGVSIWSSERPRATIDLTPMRSPFERIKPFLPHVAILSLALLVGAGAATFATAPAMTDGADVTAGVSAVDARNMGLALNVDATGQQKKQAAIGRDVGAMKTEIVRLQRALDQSKANQATLNRAAAGQEDVKALKAELASLQKTLEATRETSAAKIEALAAKVEQPKDDGARVAELQARLDKIEKAAAPVVAKAADAGPDTTGSIAAPDAAGQVVRNWTVREVYDGIALLDSRKGPIEVMTGANVPGLGRIRKIERRDRQWVVMTDRGLILQRP